MLGSKGETDGWTKTRTLMSHLARAGATKNLVLIPLLSLYCLLIKGGFKTSFYAMQSILILKTYSIIPYFYKKKGLAAKVA